MLLLQWNGGLTTALCASWLNAWHGQQGVPAYLPLSGKAVEVLKDRGPGCVADSADQSERSGLRGSARC